MKRFVIFVLLVALSVLALYRWNEQRNPPFRPEKFTPAEGAKLDLNDVKVLAAMEEEYTKLVDAVVPSVVSITASRKVPMGYLVDPFELLFNRRLRGVPQEREQRSLGSGVIVSKEGHILTNNHVVADVDEVRVQLSSGKEVPAKVIGTDPQSDIAVLKIDGENVTPLPLADSDQVKVGQRVIAVGNPFGLEETVTQGIVSAKGRRAMQDSANEFFQTDAAINPGNSGGPLVNLRGEIIGINNAIGGQTGNWAGIGFAIPSNVARRTMDSILKTGHVVRGYLGVVIQPLTPDLAQQFGVKDARGALVAEVTPDSPAEKAGIKSGDVIVKFNGKNVRDVQDLRARVGEIGIGEKADVTVKRGDMESTLTAKIEEQPENLQAGPSRAPANPLQPQIPQQPAMRGALAGVTVNEIPPDHRGDLPENVHGVMVAEVDPNSPAAESLQAGDVIEEIDRQPINSVKDYDRIAQSLNGSEKHMLFIARGRTRSFVVLQPG